MTTIVPRELKLQDIGMNLSALRAELVRETNPERIALLLTRIAGEYIDLSNMGLKSVLGFTDNVVSP